MDTVRRLLILGGSDDHPGGVEAFCERSAIALDRHTPGWRAERIATSTAYLTLAKLGPYLRGLRALIRHRRAKPDIVWLQYVNLPDLTYLLLARMLGMRVMVTPHLGSNWRSQSNGWMRRFSGWALSKAHRLALISPTQADEIALPADVPRSLIRNFLPEAILTGPLPDPASAPPALQLIHSGRLSEGKGSHLVVEACALLKQRGVPFEARITGGASPDFQARLRDLIARHGLGQQVHYLGRVPEDDLLDYLRGADMLVHPSKIDSYPLIVLEAMASRSLAVCMELAGARDMVERYGGHIVSQGNAVTEIADWLTAQNLSDIRARAGEAAAMVRADYAWARCADALDRALTACVTGSIAATEPARVVAQAG